MGLKRLARDPYLLTVLLVGIVTVWIKKWEPGGNIDCLWYSAIAKNVHLTHDYFHFFVSRKIAAPVYDHMPLTYWIVSLLFDWFGTSDFVARLYPCLASFASYLILYLAGKRIRDGFFGLSAVLLFVLCFDATHWNGSLLHDVPLTTYFLATYFSIDQGRAKPVWFYFASVTFALGVFTKGPIIFAVPLGFLIWLCWERDFRMVRSAHFWGSVALALALLALPLLPALSFDGRNYYSILIEGKRSYVASSQLSFAGLFAYAVLVVKFAPVTLFCFLGSLPRLRDRADPSASSLRLAFCIAMSIIIPLSFCSTRFPHYILPFYPFFSLVAADSFSRWLAPYAQPLRRGLLAMACLAILVLAIFPIKTSGRRDRELLNLADWIKFDENLGQKTVYFVGPYGSTAEIFQTFSFYGSIDVVPLARSEVDRIDLKKAYVVIPKSELGPSPSGFPCSISTSRYCVLADAASCRFRLPGRRLPHEVFGALKSLSQ